MVSDIAYLVSAVFYNENVFMLSILILVGSVTLPFALLLLEGKEFSKLHQKYPLGYSLFFEKLQLKITKAGETKNFAPFGENDNLIKLIGYFLYAILLFVVQFFWVILFSLPYTPWLLFGGLCTSFGTMAFHEVKAKWLYVWSGKQIENTEQNEVEQDRIAMNRIIFVHFLVESLPQLAIQIYNSVLMSEFKGVTIFSISFSLFLAFNGIYRYGYYMFLKGYSIDKVPGYFDSKRTDTNVELSEINVSPSSSN
jgi:hypothetical protein